MPRRKAAPPADAKRPYRDYGSGSVWTRKDGRVVASFAHEGRRIPRYFNSGDQEADRAEARRWLREQTYRRDSGQLVAPSRERLGPFVDSWIDRLETDGRSPSTLRAYRGARKRLADLADLELSKLDAARIDRAFVRLRRSGLSASTVRVTYAALHGALEYATVTLRLIPFNPAKAVKVRAPRAEAFAVWTADQIGAFLRSVQDDPLAPFFRVLFGTGLRQGEARGLRWRDVDLAAGYLHVRQTLAGDGRRAGPPKGKRSRSLALSAPLGATLRHQWIVRARQLGREPKPDELVFVHARGIPLTGGHLRMQFHRLSAEAGLPEIRLHDCRHSAATLLVRRHPLHVAREMLGHSSITQTERYLHAPTEALAAARDDLSAAIGL